MGINIKKIKAGTEVFYPATILDAVKDATATITIDGQQKANPYYAKNLREILSEIEEATAGSLTDFDDRLGKNEDLTTANKETIVGAINEIASNAQGATGDLDDLETTAKDSLVSAVNELKGNIDTINGDAATEGSIKNEVATAISNVVDGAPETFDTLKEIAEWLTNDDNKDAAEIISDVKANSALIGAPAKEEVSHAATQEDVEAGKAESVGDTVIDSPAEEATGFYKVVEEIQETSLSVVACTDTTEYADVF